MLWITWPLRGLTLALCLVLSYTLYRGESQDMLGLLCIKWLTYLLSMLYCYITTKGSQGTWDQHYQGASLYHYFHYQHFKAVHQCQHTVKTAFKIWFSMAGVKYRVSNHGILRLNWVMGREFPICKGIGTGFALRTQKSVNYQEVIERFSSEL